MNILLKNLLFTDFFNSIRTMNSGALSYTLKLLMAHNEIRTVELARELGIPQPTLHRIVSGKTHNPHSGTLKQIAEFFSVPVEQLKGLQPIKNFKSHGLLTPMISNTQEIPLISWEEALVWPEIKANYAPQQTISSKVEAKDPFALQMNDSSMEPLFDTSTILIINPDKQPKDRSFAVVKRHNTDKALFRQVLIDDNNHYLKPISPDLTTFGMQLLQKEDSYVGVLIQALRNYH